MEAAEIWNRFHHADAATADSEHATTARDTCFEAAQKLDALLPDGREKSLAMTHLEQASMWVTAGLARQQAEAEAAADSPAPEQAAPAAGDGTAQDGTATAAGATGTAAAPAEHPEGAAAAAEGTGAAPAAAQQGSAAAATEATLAVEQPPASSS